jgi:hypothetical protein
LAQELGESDAPLPRPLPACDGLSPSGALSPCLWTLIDTVSAC